MNATKPHGWEVDVECCEFTIYIPGSDRNTIITKHYRGCTEQAAKRKAMLTVKHFRAVTSTRPLDQLQWERAYGIAQRM